MKVLLKLFHPQKFMFDHQLKKIALSALLYMKSYERLILCHGSFIFPVLAQD